MAQEVVVEEIIVTAQRRAENIQDVPVSITAFSGDFLVENGMVSIEDVSRMTPNFSVYGSNRLSIRGIGSSGNNAIESSVGVFIDGVYYPRPRSVIGKLLDVETFEVLRGPQGTLFGRNTVAGALDHCVAGHLSAEGAHGAMLEALDKAPLLQLGLRLGEGSGAALAIGVLKGAVACHSGMATFDEAGVAGG